MFRQKKTSRVTDIMPTRKTDKKPSPPRSGRQATRYELDAKAREEKKKRKHKGLASGSRHSAVDAKTENQASTKCKRGWDGEEYNAIYLAFDREPSPVNALDVVERLIAAGARPTGAEAPLLRDMGKDHQRVLARGPRSERIAEVGQALDLEWML